MMMEHLEVMLANCLFKGYIKLLGPLRLTSLLNSRSKVHAQSSHHFPHHCDLPVPDLKG